MNFDIPLISNSLASFLVVSTDNSRARQLRTIGAFKLLMHDVWFTELFEQVYERASTFRPVGSFVAILPYGARALQVVDPITAAWLQDKEPIPTASVRYDKAGMAIVLPSPRHV